MSESALKIVSREDLLRRFLEQSDCMLGFKYSSQSWLIQQGLHVFCGQRTYQCWSTPVRWKQQGQHPLSPQRNRLALHEDFYMLLLDKTAWRLFSSDTIMLGHTRTYF